MSGTAFLDDDDETSLPTKQQAKATRKRLAPLQNSGVSGRLYHLSVASFGYRHFESWQVNGRRHSQAFKLLSRTVLGLRYQDD